MGRYIATVLMCDGHVKPGSFKDDTNRIKFTTTNIVKEKYEDSSWKETEAIQWNEITDIEKLTINVTDTPAFS